MKKVISLIKKIVLIVGVFFVSIWNKVWARLDIKSEDLNPIDFTESAMYGSPALGQSVGLIWGITEILMIPIFLIGVIVYLKKSSSSKIRKIITILIALFLFILLIWGISCIIGQIRGY